MPTVISVAEAPPTTVPPAEALPAKVPPADAPPTDVSTKKAPFTEKIDNSPDRQTPLTDHLVQWLALLSESKENGRTMTLLVWTLQYKYAIPLSIAFTSQQLADFVFTEKQLFLRMGLGLYSCLFVQIAFQKRSTVLQSCVTKLIKVGECLEEDAHPKSKARMMGTVQKFLDWRRFYVPYAVSTEFFTVLMIMVGDARWHKHAAEWLTKPFGWTSVEVSSYVAAVLRLTALPWQAFALALCLASAYAMQLLFIVVYHALADMYDALGRCLEAGSKLSKWAPLQAILAEASMDMEAAVKDLVPHILVVHIAVPLLCTADVALYGLGADIYAIGMGPLALAIFAPLCFAGDAAVEARKHVGSCAGWGPWHQETVSQARIRLGIMLASDGRGGQFSVGGYGSLDIPAFNSVIKTWFNVLQCLINVQSVQTS
ncbi:hypothetical protein ONE63_008241 [Megalurothrips usitatus]|uniref:Odorant receptor n=1 Tax=Megalurothrips usitatus TaxID=439358 RepID=A0AAV7XQB0_9NEOP|nr:hypothetical protein ONE63_008241 [Megalurothrips usitatus]